MKFNLGFKMKAIFKPGNKFPVPFFYGLFLMLLTSGNAFSYTRIGIHKPSPESNRLNFLKSNLRIMKNILFILLSIGLNTVATNAQISKLNFKPFIGNQKISDTSGPGLTSTSGDIMITVEDEDEMDIILVSNKNGKLSLIAKNNGLLMGSSMLGASGGSSPYLGGEFLHADYTIGSNSGFSDVSMVFEKRGNEYYFTHYASQTWNYGIENYFLRTGITEQQTGAINFKDASEEMILKKAGKGETDPFSADAFISKGVEKFSKWIPSGYELVTYAEGDLNGDIYKKDAVLWMYSRDDEFCLIQLLLHQSAGAYMKAGANNVLFMADDSFNPYNSRVAVKNSFFTLEQRVGTGADFDHRYFTFKYKADSRNWLLHRYDVEHFSGFKSFPDNSTTHLTMKEFGALNFEKLDYAPGDYFYDPALAKISGIIIKKSFPGSQGEIMVLQSDYPVNALALPLGYGESGDPETDDRIIRGERELQVVNVKDLNMRTFINKKVLVTGKVFRGQTRAQYTTLLLEVQEIKPQP